ncbi:hypothetical protein MF672_031745 [Actinomadura sp. ATCC 31491]|uniref:Uncharacterized protein n=1 Tax=Actinomadura luzonensis TaxID=2805427 RepID=A0ABT0G197_9ACTN|nr:hypothetical protein [Actinomadura luzonensis]MCK2218332.1 hypothetical protein [Actinomadura luzonensis]
MTTVNERTIAEELRRMAGEAVPVNAAAYAARAAARSARRRLSWSLAALATLVAGLGFVLPLDEASTTAKVAAPPAPGLPANTAGQLRLVRDCMPAGGPSVNVNPDWRDPAHGTVRDFRVLAEYRDKNGVSALVGSVKGFVLCTPSSESPEPPVFTYWGNQAPGRLTGFPGQLSVDVYAVHYWYRKSAAPHDNYVRVVAGRVAPGVRRVTIGWSSGRRTDAVVNGGFFIARTLAAIVTSKSPNSGEPTRHVDSPPVTVTAYDAAGRVAGRHEGVRFGWRGPGSATAQ